MVWKHARPGFATWVVAGTCIACSSAASQDDAHTSASGGPDAGSADAAPGESSGSGSGGPAQSGDAASLDATSTDATTTDAATTDAAGGGPTPDASVPVTASASDVLQRHKNSTRDGLYVDPLLTHAAVSALHADLAFTPPALAGPIYAQPLYVENGVQGQETLYVATEQDVVYALEATSGALLWQKAIGTPVPVGLLDCANIDPVGVTGTPVIDLATRTLYVDASSSPDGGVTKQHLLVALSIDDGTVRSGYPVDLAARLAARGVSFTPAIQQQRGALALLQGNVYVPFAGYAEDCDPYHGFVVGVATASPSDVFAWSVPAVQGGIWGAGGPATDGQSLYVATGNTDTGVSSAWAGGEAVVRLTPQLAFSGNPSDYFTPSNWFQMDAQDQDLGSSQPILLDVPGSTHPKLAVAMGKTGVVHLLDRSNLGGIGTGNGTSGEGLASALVTTNEIINAGTVYSTPSGTYAALRGHGVGCAPNATLAAVRLGVADPPSVTPVWCAATDSWGSPIASTTDGHSESVVWTVGADGDGSVHAVDGETGAILFGGGGTYFPPVARYQSPILVKGRAIWANSQGLVAYTVR
jgi:outer membrane protein assembly factor BamB